MAHIAFTILIFAIIILSYIPAIIFFVKFMSIDLEGALNALFQVSAFTGILYAMIVVYIRRQQINRIFRSLSKIYDASEN